MRAGKRCSDWALRAVLPRSPGRPGVAQRESRRRFWAAIAVGRSSEAAAIEVGVSPAVGARWFREAGGMSPRIFAPSAKPPSERYLSFAEREELALLRARGCGVRETARRLGRAASTISRELRRNAATRGGGLEYRATTAQWHAERAARRPKPAKLATNSALRAYVRDRLAGAVAAPGRAGAAGPAGARSGRRPGRARRAGGDLEGPSPRTAAASALGERVEPAADLPAPAARLPRRWDDADQARGHLPVALRPRPRRAAARADGLTAHRASPPRAAGAESGAWPVACRARGDDQPAPGRGGRPGGAGALGG